MKPVTRRQKEVLQAIIDFTGEHKYSPTVRELCDIMNVASSSTMHGFLKKLKIHGLITWEPEKPRTIAVVEKVQV